MLLRPWRIRFHGRLAAKKYQGELRLFSINSACTEHDFRAVTRPVARGQANAVGEERTSPATLMKGKSGNQGIQGTRPASRVASSLDSPFYPAKREGRMAYTVDPAR